MSDDIAKKTAEDFRLLGGQEPRPRPADPFNQPARAAPPEPQERPSQGGAAAIEAALERALARVLERQPGGGMPAAEILARLDEMKARAGERDDEMAFELRNALPGRIRREIHEQLRPTEERLAALERGLTDTKPKRSYGPAIAGGVLFAVLTGLIVSAIVIFERPLRHWGQETLYPVLGIGLPVAQKVQPPEKNAPPLGER